MMVDNTINVNEKGKFSSLDVHSEFIANTYKLSRVGVKGIKKQAAINRFGTVHTLTMSIDVSVDLPEYLKGSHMSRNAEVLAEIVDSSLKKPVYSLEDMAAKISLQLLKKHEYAKHAEVSIHADFFMNRGMKTEKESLEYYILHATSTSIRSEDRIKTSKKIGVEVLGMSACPCAMETCRDFFIKDRPEISSYLTNIPVITHNQRNRVNLFIEVPDNFSINAEDLIDLVEDSFSTPTYNILKRDDEGKVVMNAHKNPKFVEDVVRDILARVSEKYKSLPDYIQITVKSESEESIHKYNAFAEKITTLGDLKKENMYKQ